MQVKNVSARGWWINGKMVAPGTTETVEATVADIGDNPDLVIVEDEAKDEDKDMTKAEIVAALKEKGIAFDVTAKKADLQVLLDGVK